MPLKSLSKVSVGASRFNRLPNGFKRSSQLTQTMPIDGDNVASIRVVIGTTAVGTGVFNRSATTGVTIGVTASGQQTDQQHFGTATVGVVISSTASALVTSTHSGTATASIVITTTAAGETGETHAGVASCQVNLSVSAAGSSFDPLTQVIDESGYGNTMTLVSSPSSSTTPSFSTDAAIGSRSVDFDKSSDHGATVPSTYEDVLSSPFTFSAWLKPNDGQTTQVSYIFHSSGEFKRASGTSEWTFQIFTHQSGDIVAGIQYWNGTSSLYRRRQTLNPAFSDGAQSSWTHLAVTVDSTCTPIIYINGSSVTVANNGNDTLSLSNFSSVDSFSSIGSYGSVNGSGQYVPSFEYDGKLDDISIWSTTLTSTQISNLYNSGNGTDLTGSSNLAAWWKMGDNNIITHSGTANIGVTISATASGTVVSVHSGVASCQVNLSVSASGFNANTTVPDETSNGNNMTLYGDSVFSTDSAVGTRAVTFDGSGDYGVINDPLESTFQSPFSISMWVKPDDGQPSGDSGRLLSTWGGTSYTIVLIQSEHGNINMNFQLGGSARTNHTPTAVFTNGTQSSYTHLVCVVDSSATLTLYVNGNSTSVTSSGSGSLSDYSSSQNIAIGTHNPASPTDGTTFTGKIDDISIWNTELTSTQASNIYNSGSGTDLTGSSNLVGYWKMGDSNTITHSGTATVSVDVTASASGTTSTTHSGTASCQVNLSASASGSVVAGGFTISTFDTETNILASTPSDGTIAYGTDTESYYVYDSSLGWAEFIPS